nr:putative internal virion protein [uncultured Mediterranean phage uvMED]
MVKIKNPTVKRVSRCFKEVQRITGDLLPDEKINEILDEVKIQINESKFKQNQEKTENLIADNVAEKLEYEQALKKRNLAENNIKALELVEKVKDAVDLSEGKLKPKQALLGVLVGIQEFSLVARNSIGSKQDTIEVVELTRMYQAIKDVGDDVWDNFTSGALDLEIKKAMLGETVLNEQALQISKILKSYQEDWRLRLNDLGANIGKLDDWLTRQSHNTEKMANASKGSKKVAENRTAWREFIKTRLDLPRTFEGVRDPEKIDEILDGIYDSFMANDHLKHGGTNSIYGTKNVTNRLNASRVLHFKDATARHEYDIAFGEPSLKESVLGVLSNSARNIALMQELGTNPKDTFNKALAVLRKQYKKTNPEFSRQLNFENFSKEFSELDGSINGASNEIAAKVGMTIRAIQTMGKLGFAAPTSIADLGQYMATSKFQGRGLFNGLFEALGSLFKTQDKAAMEVLGVVSNSIHSFQGNKYGSSSDTWGTMGKLQNMFFKYNSLNRWISSLKSGMTVGLARHYGMLADTKWLDLKIRERNVLKLYGFDEGKWDMLRSIKTLDVENKRYMTAEDVNSISNDTIKKYTGKDLSDREIRNFKKDLEMTWRNVLVDQAMHGTPEPDSAVRAFMNQGYKKGTAGGEVLRFMGQFKSFPITIWKKIIGRELKSYGPDDSKFAQISGLTSMILLSAMFGYIAMSVKDMLKGRSPRDPKRPGVLFQAFAQGGGVGIYGDFIFQELQNEYGGGMAETIMGPTFGDIEKIFSIVQNANDPAKAGKKFVQFAEGNIPFLNMYYSKAAYDYLVGYQLKEFLDPGYFDRISEKHNDQRGQTYFLKP